MGSQVFYMDGRSHSLQTGLVAKMLTVFEAAGLDKKIKEALDNYNKAIQLGTDQPEEIFFQTA